MRYLPLIGFALLGCQAALAADIGPAAVAPVSPDEAALAGTPQGGRITLIEENDAFAYPGPTDRWYTQGGEVNYLSAPMGPAADAWVPAFLLNPAVHERRFEFLVGQDIFTPVNLTLNPPDPADRPYAAWLYAGAGLYQQYGNGSLDHFQIQVGVVGPAALGEETQNAFHRLLSSFIPQYQAAGWDYQIKNEPGVVLSYEHKWRFGMPLGAGLSADVIPEVGGSVGNVYTYAEAGTFLRLGKNLNADYGPARIQPALSGGTWFDPAALDGPFGWYLFVGGQVRAIARDIFLDGNTLVPSAAVVKYPIVGDVSGGLSLFWGDIAKVDFVLTVRSKEFVGQSALDHYGGINISFRTP